MKVEGGEPYIISSPEDAARVAAGFIGENDREVFFVMCLIYSLTDEDDEVENALFTADDRLIKTMNEKSFCNKYGLDLPIDDEEKYGDV